MKFTNRILAMLFVILLCFNSFSLSLSAINIFDDTLRVNSDISLYSEANTSSNKILTLTKESIVTLLESTNTDMAKVRIGNNIGYCHTKYLYCTENSDVTIIAYTRPDLNLRTEPNTTSNVILCLGTQLYLQVLDNSNTSWAKVNYNDKVGYLSKDYVTLSVYTSKDSIDRDLMPNLFKNTNTNSDKIYLNNNSITLDGETTSKLTVMSSQGQIVNNKVKFISSDNNVAAVSVTGLISAKSNGKATVTAVLNDDNSVFVKCDVSVTGIITPTVPLTEPTTIKETDPTDPTTLPTIPTEPTEPTTEPTIDMEDAIILQDIITDLYVGNNYVVDCTSRHKVNWAISNNDVATISDNGVITAKSAGVATVTANNSYQVKSFDITVKENKSTVNISNKTRSMSVGMTLLLTSTTNGAKFVSSNTDIAQINQMTDDYGKEFAFIVAKAEGTVNITVSNENGASNCILTIAEAQPVRSAYTTTTPTSQGCQVDFVAVTDQTRSSVKFEYTVNGVTSTLNATGKTVDGNTFVWSAKEILSNSGSYSVVAYSKTDTTDFATCSNAKSSFYITSQTDPTVTSCTKHYISKNGLNLIANFEGYRKNVEFDNITGSHPTVAYGRVITSGECFYNGLTKSEAMAYLQYTVNNNGYANSVNNFLIGRNIKFNQYQFDALVSFVYNLGSGIFDDANKLKAVFADSYDKSVDIEQTKTGYINASYVNLRSAPSTSDSVVLLTTKNTKITLLDTNLFNNNWYYIELSTGEVGYMHSDYITLDSEASKDLDFAYINKENFIKAFLQYHHAGGCIKGLLNRRVDEVELFLTGDYAIDGYKNKNNYQYTCTSNSNFGL